ARARAATIFGQNRLHMVSETPVEGLVHTLDGDASDGRLFAGFGGNRGRTVFEWHRNSILYADSLRIARDKFDGIRDLSNELLIAQFFEKELLARCWAGERNLRRQ